MALGTTMMDSFCVIKRSVTTLDSTRGTAEDWANAKVIASNVPCSMQEPSGDTKDLYAQRNVFVNVSLYTYTDPGAEVDDRAEVTNPTTKVVEYVLIRGHARPVNRGRLWETNGTLVAAPA